MATPKKKPAKRPARSVERPARPPKDWSKHAGEKRRLKRRVEEAAKKNPARRSSPTERPALRAPSLACLTKLASVLVHAQEAMSTDGHPFDLVAIGAIIGDPEVRELLETMNKLALLPVLRRNEDPGSARAQPSGPPFPASAMPAAFEDHVLNQLRFLAGERQDGVVAIVTARRFRVLAQVQGRIHGRGMERVGAGSWRGVEKGSWDTQAGIHGELRDALSELDSALTDVGNELGPEYHAFEPVDDNDDLSKREGACVCGHAKDRHGLDPDYPSSTACRLVTCDCNAFEQDGGS